MRYHPCVNLAARGTTRATTYNFCTWKRVRCALPPLRTLAVRGLECATTSLGVDRIAQLSVALRHRRCAESALREHTRLHLAGDSLPG